MNRHQCVHRAFSAPEGGTGMKTAHIHMMKSRVFLGALVLVVMLAASALALNDASSISFAVSVEPAALKAPGEVTVSVRVANVGTQDITVPMTLYDADDKILTAAFDGGAITSLKVNEVVTWEGKWQVSQKHLDAGKIIFNLRLNTTDATGAIAQVSIAASANIAFDGDKVELKVSREILPEVVRPNNDVTVTYTLTNTGTVGLKDITVRENRLISNTQQTVAGIAPGASAKLTFTKKAANTSLESSAVVLYKKEGTTTQLRTTVDRVTIPIAKPGFTSELTADKATLTIGEKVALTLTLKNTGNITYEHVKVTDPKLGEVFPDVRLAAGESLTQTKEVTMMAPTTFKFSIALEDNTGTKQTETTNEVKVSAYAQGQIMRLNVLASSDREAIEQVPGKVRFTILVTNDSSSIAKPVNIYHGSTQITSIAQLDPGQSVSVTRDFSLSQAGKYRFTVRTVDALDNTVSFDSNELNIAYIQPTAAPTKVIVPTVEPIVTYSPVPPGITGGLADQGRDTLFILVISLGVLFGISLILFLISSLMRAKARMASNAAYDHLQVAQKRDYKDPDTYQGDSDVRDAAAPLESPAPVAAVTMPEKMPHEKYLQDAEKPIDEPPQDIAPDESEPSQQVIAPLSADEDAAYRLVRDGEEVTETLEASERRIRRAAKHTKLPQDDE